MKHFINGTYLLYHEISIQVVHNFVKMQCNRASTIFWFQSLKGWPMEKHTQCENNENLWSLIRGRKGYLILYRVTWKRTFGTYTKQIVFGGLSHIIIVFYQCKGGKNVKHRVTIALLANVGGEKEAAAVIGSLKVWGGTSREQTGANFLLYNYFSHSKGWMRGEIVDKIVSKFRGN